MEKKSRTTTREKILNALKLCVGLFLLGYIITRHFDVETFSNLKISWGYFALYILLYIPLIALAAWRWRAILASIYGVRLPFWRTLCLTYFGQTLALVTPSRIGDLGRAAFIKDHLPLKKALLTLVYDKGSELVAFLGISLASLIYLRPRLLGLLPALRPWSMVAILMVCGTIGVAGAVIIKRRFIQPLKNHLPDLHTSLMIFTISLLVMTITASFGYLAALTIGLRPPFFEYVAVMALLGLILLLPVTVGGIGLREGSAAVAYPLIGISQTEGILVSWIIAVTISIVPALVGTIIYLILKGAFMPTVLKERKVGTK